MIAPQDGLYSGYNFAWAERLAYVIVCTHLKAEQPVKFLHARGDHDDRNGILPTQFPANLNAVAPWKRQIQ